MKPCFVLLLCGYAQLTACGSTGSGQPLEAVATSNSQPSSDQTSPAPHMQLRTAVKDMGVADYMWVACSDGDCVVSFDGADPAALYNLVVQSADLHEGVPTPKYTVQFSSSDASNENVQKYRSKPAHHYSPSASRKIFPADKLVDVSAIPESLLQSVQKFDVGVGIGIISKYDSVTAALYCQTSMIAVYVDQVISSDNDSRKLTDAELNQLCKQFDAIAESMVEKFGKIPDINKDGVVVLLITPSVNKGLNAGDSYVSGFFSPNDMAPKSDYNQNSNEREILYLAAPDPDGLYGAKVDRELILRGHPATFAHELQHLKSHYHHVTVANANNFLGEELWLNEGLSHLMEDLEGYNVANPFNVQWYLTQTQLPIVYRSLFQDKLALRGGYYLFLRYLFEQSVSPDEFIKTLIESESVGTKGIENAFSSDISDFNTFERFLMHFGVMLAVNGYGVTSDPHFTFKTANMDATTGWANGICFPCTMNIGYDLDMANVHTDDYKTLSSFDIWATGTKIVTVDPSANELHVSGPSEAKIQAAIVRVK